MKKKSWLPASGDRLAPSRRAITLAERKVFRKCGRSGLARSLRARYQHPFLSALRTTLESILSSGSPKPIGLRRTWLSARFRFVTLSGNRDRGAHFAQNDGLS
jgi:hypothetical protein